MNFEHLAPKIKRKAESEKRKGDKTYLYLARGFLCSLAINLKMLSKSLKEVFSV